MGMGFENCKMGFGEKNELGNGIGTPHIAHVIFALHSAMKTIL